MIRRLLICAAMVALWQPLMAQPELSESTPASTSSNVESVSDMAPEESALAEHLDRIIRLSGLMGLSSQARHLAQSELNNQQAALGFQYQVAARIAQRWSPKSLTARLKQPLESLTEQQLQQLFATLEREVMQQARNKENQAIELQDSTEFLTYVEKLRAQPPSPERLNAIADLDRAMHFSEMILHTRVSVYAQLQQVLPNWQSAESWQQRLRKEVREFLLFTYRHTPNDGIRALINAYRQPILSQWLRTSTELLKEEPLAETS